MELTRSSMFKRPATIILSEKSTPYQKPKANYGPTRKGAGFPSERPI
jgi:hypothetical protein